MSFKIKTLLLINNVLLIVIMFLVADFEKKKNKIKICIGIRINISIFFFITCIAQIQQRITTKLHRYLRLNLLQIHTDI